MKYLDAPKVKRTHCYVQNPIMYDINCPICGGSKVDWSEFEGHIWCYECEKDIYIDLYHSGIFSGPIPTGLANSLGVSFDRINIETKEILDFDTNIAIFNSSWVKTEELMEYDKKNYYPK